MSPIVVSAITTGQTFENLLAEFYARGYDYLNLDDAGRARASRWINQAYIEDVAEPYPWTELEDTASGAAPLVVEDLKDVISVIDTSNDNQLFNADSRDLADADTSYETTTGTPESWFFSAANTISTYPVSTSASLSVLYTRVPEDLLTDDDVPIVANRLHPLIVSFAVVRALEDSDNLDEADRVRGMAERRLQKLADSMLWQSSDPSSITRVAGSLDS